MRILASVFSLLILLATAAQAVAECCDACGSDCGCRKVCHLKCEMKKVTKHEYSCECEDFCVPCKSEKIGYKCECECKPGLCGCKEHCKEKAVYRPTGATLRTKNKLVKHEVTKEEPTYKWVVEKVCDRCVSRCRTCENGQSRAEVEAEAMAEFEAAPTPPAAPTESAGRAAVGR